ncbi:MAG: chloride channel protein [Acidobacteriota bacterium]
MPVSKSVFNASGRLVLFCVLVGFIGAFAALGFDAMVEFAQRWLLTGIGRYGPPSTGATTLPQIPQGLARLWLPLATTLGGLLSGWIVYRWAPEAEGHGTDAAIGAYHRRGGEIRGRIPLIKALASALTIGSGGVAGREGPTAQISVGLGTSLARWTGLRGQERRDLVLAGMAAGLAAMFRAPLGMAIFSVEILYSGMVFESEALIYTVIAAVTSYAVFGLFQGWDRLFLIPDNLTVESPWTLLAFAVLGLLAGLLGAILPTLLYRVRDLFARLPGPPHIRPAIGGLFVGLLALAMPEVLGTGYGWVELAILEKLPLATILLLLVLKGPAMALTIGSGGSGGVFAPTVTIGAMLGAAVGTILNLAIPTLQEPVAAFVVVGMASVFAAAARTPISTLIMVAEMTGGYDLMVAAMLANIIAFLVQRSLTAQRRYPTLYISQVETREDSPLHRGVFVRRAIELLDTGGVEPSDVRLPRLVNLLRWGGSIPVGKGESSLLAVHIEAGSRLTELDLAESLGRIEGLTAVALLRDDNLLTPRGNTRFQAGDRLLTVANRTAEEELRRLIRAPSGDRSAHRDSN